MRQNPLGDALTFLVATDKLWFTVAFWLLLLGSAAIATLAWRADPAQRSVQHIGYGLLRVIIGIMWWQQSLWKIPPHYDWGLIHWMEVMVEMPRPSFKARWYATSCCPISPCSAPWSMPSR